MAAIDSSTVASSAEVFSSNYSLPQIRALHKSLHVQIEEKSSRLRTQVGGSYRELLGTADSIVRMRGENEGVQELLGKMGGRCGRAVVTAKAKGLVTFVAAEDRLESTRVARIQLLDKCGLMAGRLLRNGGGLSPKSTKGDRLLLASKVLVLLRLLLKRLGDGEVDKHTAKVLQEANKTYGSLRSRLRRSIDKVLEQEDGDSERRDILKALCAHSLVSNSGARDVLRYFLDVRASAIALAFDTDELERKPNTEDVVRSLKLYTRSLLDVQAIVPTRLSQALNSLKSRPLLADPDLQQLDGLRFDIYEKWCGEEIQYFTPFVRHNDLDGKQARETLTGWGQKGGQVLLEGLKTTLSHMTEFKSIMDLRTSVLLLWIRDGNRTKGFDPAEMQHDLREVINSRMLSVIEIKVNKLHLVGSEVQATLESWQDGVTDKRLGLWDDSRYDEALAMGAGPLIEEVVNRLYGRTDAVSKAGHRYTSWFEVIDDSEGVVESLRKQRWDNDYDEVEDEETIEARQQILSKDDPKLLQDKLQLTLDVAFENLDKQLQQLWARHPNAPAAAYLTRVIRDIRRNVPDRPATRNFGLSIVPSLHTSLAEDVLTKPLLDLESSGLKERRVLGLPLWEGEPPLPSQPSPQVFLFLRQLSHAMEDAGMDIWTSAGAAILKNMLDERLSVLWMAAVGDLSQETVEDSSAQNDESTQEHNEEESTLDSSQNQDKSMSETQEKKQNLYLQWSFDVAYLRKCIATARGEVQDKLLGVEDALWKKAALADEKLRVKMTESARDYWQRTNLLFGLLA